MAWPLLILLFTLSGGRPGRQLFMSGKGDGDTAIFAPRIFAGTAFAHNFATASSLKALAYGDLYPCQPYGVYSYGFYYNAALMKINRAMCPKNIKKISAIIN